MHAAAPVVTGLYVPAAQTRHKDAELWNGLAVIDAVPPASARYVPALHAMQAEDLTVIWYCPYGQTTHVAAPVDAWNNPRAQDKHWEEEL